MLTDYEKSGGRNPDALKQLASLEEEAGDPGAAAATLDRINYIYPVNDEDLHRHLGDLWLAQNNYAGAIREYTAVLALHPLDKAAAQYNLARAYFAAGERDKAEEHVLASLEAAPELPPRSAIAPADRGLRERETITMATATGTQSGLRGTEEAHRTLSDRARRHPRPGPAGDRRPGRSARSDSDRVCLSAATA